MQEKTPALVEGEKKKNGLALLPVSGALLLPLLSVVPLLPAAAVAPVTATVAAALDVELLLLLLSPSLLGTDRFMAPVDEEECSEMQLSPCPSICCCCCDCCLAPDGDDDAAAVANDVANATCCGVMLACRFILPGAGTGTTGRAGSTPAFCCCSFCRARCRHALATCEKAERCRTLSYALISSCCPLLGETTALWTDCCCWCSGRW